MTKGRILIVDDQQEILDSLEAILSDEGYDVVPARDGQAALHAVQSEAPDVVFLDVWIPGIDGMQTLKAIKRIDPQCSVVMMSGHGTIETAVKAIKLGATDYLEKPINLEDVLHLVDRAVKDRSSPGAVDRAKGPTLDLLIGSSDQAEHLRRSLQKASSEAGSVWLAGEKGTGKEFAARVLHYLDGKSRTSLIKVRCYDLTEENFHETMLGINHGAHARRQGKIQQAQGGTLLLSGLDRLAEPLRPLLLDMLKDLGSSLNSNTRSPEQRTRIVSTSMRGPESLAESRDFPQELLDLVAQRVIRIPELLERIPDIPLFVEFFLKEAAEEFERDISGADESALGRLMEYTWPGNVKELKILIEHVVMTAPGPTITANDLLIPSDKLRAGPLLKPFTAPDGEQENQSVSSSPVSDSTSTVPSGPDYAGDSAQHHRITRQQKTLRGNAVMYGKGLHSGLKTGLTLSPLPAGSGIVFGHITSAAQVPARLESVESTEMATSLRGADCHARTVEHLMAVFHAYGLTNLLVKISGEVPIMDGSALEFCKLVESAEIMSQDQPIEAITVDEPIELPMPEGSAKSMRVEPSDSFEIEYFMDYPPPIGKLHMSFTCSDPDAFKEQIAPARTFGFVKDMQMMDEMGLANGGRLSNVILLDNEKVVNPPLRFPDEFIRHKILDIIGDFYLLGRPFRAKIVARQTGHTENISMLKLLKDRLDIG